MSKALVDDYQTFIALTVHQGRWWARLSAQVYLSLEDFEGQLEAGQREESREGGGGESSRGPNGCPDLTDGLIRASLEMPFLLRRFHRAQFFQFIRFLTRADAAAAVAAAAAAAVGTHSRQNRSRRDSPSNELEDRVETKILL
ncbi:hypothetical protein VTK73DRAFT_5586 [Phialemonium thermophilum]|uniref:Uncharacterized protein n=1 Tax=Phialemonium thermophilum TaxID=223376 RepID=A0ABR3V153_9PEZI